LKHLFHIGFAELVRIIGSGHIMAKLYGCGIALLPRAKKARGRRLHASKAAAFLKTAFMSTFFDVHALPNAESGPNGSVRHCRWRLGSYRFGAESLMFGTGTTDTLNVSLQLAHSGAAPKRRASPASWLSPQRQFSSSDSILVPKETKAAREKEVFKMAEVLAGRTKRHGNRIVKSQWQDAIEIGHLTRVLADRSLTSGRYDMAMQHLIDRLVGWLIVDDPGLVKVVRMPLSLILLHLFPDRRCLCVCVCVCVVQSVIVGNSTRSDTFLSHTNDPHFVELSNEIAKLLGEQGIVRIAVALQRACMYG
jgi:hypothetical protein